MKNLILTFNNPVLPKSVKIAYINCSVKPPEHIRCFKCQKFRHTVTACIGEKEIFSRCPLEGHNSNIVICFTIQPKCLNCNENHPTYFRSCSRYKLEKYILSVKIKKTFLSLKHAK